MATSRAETQSAATLPLDIMAEILCRLPMKSLARFQCVCRQWRSLTHEHYFLHKKVVSTRRRRRPPPPPLTIIQKYSLEKIDVYELDHDHHGRTRSAGSNYYSIDVNFDDPIIPTDTAAANVHYDVEELMSEYLLSNSVHGLVACVRESKLKLSYYLLNPIHKDLFVKLPDPPSLQIQEIYAIFSDIPGIGLGFDESTGEYKVVRLAYPGLNTYGVVFEILTLGGGGAGRRRDHNWRYVAQLPPNVDITPGTPVFLHGVLHWNGHFLLQGEHVIVTLDVKEEKLGPLIPFPSTSTYGGWDVAESLYEWKGHICVVFLDFRQRKLEVWMLKDYTLHKWTKICGFQKQYAPFWGRYVDLHVVGVTDDCILFQEATDHETCTWQLFAYHLHKKKFEWLQCPLSSEILEIHQESFLSPKEFF